MSLVEDENTQAKDAWNRNAEFWDERMGEGNDFLTSFSGQPSRGFLNRSRESDFWM